MTLRDTIAITDIVDAFIRKDHPKQKQALSIILHELCKQQREIAANQVRESILLREQAAWDAARQQKRGESYYGELELISKYSKIEDWRKDK
jgi:hypothetical protein